MNGFITWYFEKCRISTILLAGALVWVIAACLLLGEVAPAVYVGLHAVTTGVFTFAILRVRQSGDPQSQAASADAEAENASAVQKQSA